MGKLIHLLIFKSIVESLLIAAIVVGFYIATGNTHLRGVLDGANATIINGWVVDEARPDARIEVQLYIDDQFIADQVASQLRADVHEANRAADDWHGFVFQTPALAPGEHEARVYAAFSTGQSSRRTLQMIGKPYRFHTE